MFLDNFVSFSYLKGTKNCLFVPSSRRSAAILYGASNLERRTLLQSFDVPVASFFKSSTSLQLLNEIFARTGESCCFTRIVQWLKQQLYSPSCA